MPNTPTPYKYYPALSNLISPEDLPDFLSFIKDGLTQIFDKIYYKEYQVSKSTTGSSAFYSLDIVSRTKLALELPGTEIFFVLNPDYEDSTISSFPITVFWQWEIMRFVRYFNVNGFSFSPEDFYNLALEILGISEEQILLLAINTFVVTDDPLLSKFDKLLSDINDLFGTDIHIDEDAENKLQQLVIQLQVLDKKVIPAVFSLYILASDLNATKQKVNQFLSAFIPTDIEEFIKKIITPKARVTLALSAAIEFPHKILAPVNAQGVEIVTVPPTLSKFVFAEAQLYADTEKGIGYQVELAGTLVPQYATIGKTGLIIEIQNLKFDLSKNTNIPEADLDGRPNDFVGVYARAISITFPPKWFHSDTNTPAGVAATLRLGAYDLLIGTGGLSGTIMLETVPVVTSGTISYFHDEIAIQYPIILFNKKPGTDEIVEVTVNNVSQLEALLYPSTTDPTKPVAPYAFKFPITLTDLTDGQVKTFNNMADYQLFLSHVSDTTTLWKTIGSSSGFRVGFNKFDITFKQNKVISSNIKGALEIKKFVYPDGAHYPDNTPIPPNTVVHIDITGHLTDDGDFNLTAAAEPPYPIVLPEVFTYNLKSVELGKQDDDFYIGTAGTIEFEGFLKNTLNLGPIEINKLRIYSDGTIEFDGGSINLVKPIVLKLGPVEITVSALHYGSVQKEVNGVMRKFNYFGFDGGISVNPLGIEIRGDGVKFYYCTDDLPNKPHSYLHIQTLYLDLTIPSSTPVAIINGWLSIPEPGVSKEYAGGIKIQLPKAKISGSADMKLAPKYPAFIIDAEIEFPAPIPLGTFAIYGFRGLIGYRYVAEKEAAGLVSGVNTWYEYYKVPPRGIHVSKFNGPDKTKLSGTPISIGAGASLGTSFDNGTVLNIKAMVLLSIPSLFMIDGRAAIISARLGLDDSGDPPFFAFVALGDNSLEFGFGADFKLPKSSGDIVSLYAEVQAGFFFKDSSKWYVNIGTKQNPVTARILTLITLKSFLMLSAKGIEAGARADFDFKRQYGIIKVHAWAFIEVGGKISFEKPQFGAYLQAEVGADIDIKFISLYFQVGILFAVEAAKPFLIYGKFYYKVKIKILWVFKFSFSGELEVIWEFNKTVNRDAVNPLNPLITPQNINSAASQALLQDLVKGVNMLSAEIFPLKFYTSPPETLDAEIVKHIIPLDTYIDIKTEKGFLPGNVTDKIGGVTNPPANYTDLVPPDNNVKGKVIRQVKHQYAVQSIEIMSWNPETLHWQIYEPYKALYPADPNMNATLSKRLGQFQKTDGQYNTVRVLATTPFSFTEQGAPGWHIPEQYGTTNTSIFCQGQDIERKKANFLNKLLNQRYYCYDANQMFYSNGVSFLLIDRNDSDFAFVTDEPNVFSFQKSLSFNDYNKLQLILPDASVEILLTLTSHTEGVRIKYYATLINDNAIEVPFGNPDPNAANQSLPFEITATAAELAGVITYVHPDWRPVTKITIETLYPNVMQDQIDLLTEQIAFIENQNNMINLGLAQGIVQSTGALQNQLNLLVCSQGQLKTGTYRYDSEDNVYGVPVGDNFGEWIQSWDWDTYSKFPENDFGFRQDGSLRIESNFQIVKVKMLPIIQKNVETGEVNIIEVPPYTVVYNNKTANVYITNLQDYIDQIDLFDVEITYFVNGEACGEDKPEVCELLNNILDIYENCFTDPELGAQPDYAQQAVCARNINNLIKIFDSTYTEYDLKSKLAEYIKMISDFMSNPNYKSYVIAYSAVGHIIDYLSELGNCNCTCVDDPKRNTMFHEVSWLSLEDWEYNINIPDQPAIQEETEATVAGLTQYIQPIWRPETSYLLKFTLQDTVDNGASQPFNFTYGFTTAGPVGYFHIDSRSAYGDIALKANDKLLKPDNTYYTAAANQVLEDTTGLVRQANGAYVIDATTGKPLQTVAHPDNYALTSLRRYIDYSRSYPNADGNLLGAKPLFYKDESTQVYLFFSKTYVENFFRTWEKYNGVGPYKGRLKVVIKDPKEGTEVVNPPALDYVAEQFTSIPQTVEDWDTDPSPQMPYSVSQYSNLYNGQNCVLSGGMIIPKSSYMKIDPKNLKPSKLYTVIVNNLFDLDGDGVFNYNNIDPANPDKIEAQEVHRFVFQTSRYEDFFQQVASCYLTDEATGGDAVRQAVFRFEKPFTSEEILAAYNTIINVPVTGLLPAVMDNLKSNYQDPYDRIFEGILGFSPFDDAISTEFNIIKDMNTGKVIAVIVRNPEPFNNPKFPANIISDTIQVLRPAIGGIATEPIHVTPLTPPRFPDNNFKVLYSKDNSQAIIMHDSLEVYKDIDIRFKYKLWNGFDYETPDTVIIGVDVINN